MQITAVRIYHVPLGLCGMETVAFSILQVAPRDPIGTDKYVLVSQFSVLQALFGTDPTALLHRAALKVPILRTGSVLHSLNFAYQTMFGTVQTVFS